MQRQRDSWEDAQWISRWYIKKEKLEEGKVSTPAPDLHADQHLSVSWTTAGGLCERTADLGHEN